MLPAFESVPLHIDDTPGLTPTDLRARCRRLKRDYDIGLLVVDYLQLMRIPGAAHRVDEVTIISGALKALAREFDVPVLALAQLNRATENQSQSRPRLSNLRDSGAIEQDADLVVLLHRAEENGQLSNVTEAIIAKHRHGRTGTVRLAFNAELTRFENYNGSGLTKDEEAIIDFVTKQSAPVTMTAIEQANNQHGVPQKRARAAVEKLANAGGLAREPGSSARSIRYSVPHCTGT